MTLYLWIKADVSQCDVTAYLSSYPGYFREPHWFSMGLPEISRVTLGGILYNCHPRYYCQRRTETEGRYISTVTSHGCYAVSNHRHIDYLFNRLFNKEHQRSAWLARCEGESTGERWFVSISRHIYVGHRIHNFIQLGLSPTFVNFWYHFLCHANIIATLATCYKLLFVKH